MADRPDRCRAAQAQPHRLPEAALLRHPGVHAEALRHLAAETGTSRLVNGTDYPYPWTTTSVEHILDTPGFTDAERIAMLGGTAEKLLGINT